jgi:hypothetical protein
MRKTLTVLATVATVAIAAVAAPTGAEARWGWGWRGPGLLGGLVVGGLIAGALAPRYYGYYPPYYGYYGPSCWRSYFNGRRRVAYRVC